MKKNHIVAIAIVVTIPILFVSAYIGLVSYSEEQIDQITIESLYSQASNFYNDGQFERASGIYQKILSIDEKEEKAWHELGKFYNRFEICDESINHYSKYVRLFPESTRAAEGYSIAKQC